MQFDYIYSLAQDPQDAYWPQAECATRLKVLLLEAGPAITKKAISIPGAFTSLNIRILTGGFYTEPQQHADGRRLYVHVVKHWGAAVQQCYGICAWQQADYDKWASEGNAGWAYADVLPYFIRSETP